MECREVRQLAEAFVSEQLLVETTQAVVAHLERCPTCRAEVDGLRRLRAGMRSAFEGARDLAPPPDFAVALASRLQADSARQRTTRTRPRVWLAIASSVLVLVGAGLGWHEWSALRLRTLVEAVVGDHRFCALTFKLAERPIPLDEAARRYGGIYGLLGTVAPSSTTLSGGPLRVLERHSCVFGGRRFAHIVMHYKDETVSLLVAADARTGGGSGTERAASDAPSALPVTEGFHIASFRGGRHPVFVVSSLPDNDVQEVAQAMVEPLRRALAGA